MIGRGRDRAEAKLDYLGGHGGLSPWRNIGGRRSPDGGSLRQGALSCSAGFSCGVKLPQLGKDGKVKNRLARSVAGLFALFLTTAIGCDRGGCKTGEMRCHNNQAQMCDLDSANSGWDVWQDCGSIGYTCIENDWCKAYGRPVCCQ